ncbi:Pyridoxal phosphate-dependent transferase [Artemisia annua]|uniref:Pyridoxal phosphate-dependent transferase n=1 Tax=Artemisia annua TaxID=35608 RepID=A0A2U1LJK0_ARTAN|nr:Pyridoxal phosphate-dependent transferase [Artemisia annua]
MGSQTLPKKKFASHSNERAHLIPLLLSFTIFVIVCVHLVFCCQYCKTIHSNNIRAMIARAIKLTDAMENDGIAALIRQTMPYKLDESTGYIDYDQMEKSVVLFRPKLGVVGASVLEPQSTRHTKNKFLPIARNFRRYP